MDYKRRQSLKKKNGPNSWAWGKTFIGQKMQHNFHLYYLIDLVMKKNKQIKRIFEIGTGTGALSTVLGLWGVKDGIPVTTVDLYPRHNLFIFDALGIDFHKIDEYSEKMRHIFEESIGNNPCFLICDGDNKPWEFRTFVPLVPEKSVIAVHDWEQEIDYDDPEFGIRKTVDQYCEPILSDAWLALNAQFAIFKKVSHS